MPALSKLQADPLWSEGVKITWWSDAWRLLIVKTSLLMWGASDEEKLNWKSSISTYKG